jgi:hypothetical protein
VIGAMENRSDAPATSAPTDEPASEAALDVTDGEPADGFVSPPRGWPQSFSTPELTAFVKADAIAAKRVRLTQPPADEYVELASDVEVVADDALGNAVRLRARRGWDVLGGFILYEWAERPGEYHAEPHYWNTTSRGLWIDLTPRRHASLVLIESDRPRSPIPAPTHKELELMEALRAAPTAESASTQRKESARAAAKREAKEAKAKAQFALLEAKAEHKRQMANLPPSPYAATLRCVNMLPDDVVAAPDLAWADKALWADKMRGFATLCAERGPISVKNLYLQGNGMQDEGLAALASAFAYMPHLSFISLQSNHIGDAGVRAFCRSPPKAKLSQLYLWHNDIKRDGLDALGDAIERGNLKVALLVCHTNSASDESRQRLKDVCEKKGVQNSV